MSFVTSGQYFQAMEQAGIQPNFFCSDAWLNAVDYGIHYDHESLPGEWIVACKAFGGIFPGFNVKHGMIPSDEYHIVCDFEGYKGIGERTFFDYEFIYDPKQFQDLSGGKWKVFRKNVRRFERTQPAVVYHEILPDMFNAFYVDWLSNRKSFYDPERVIAWAKQPGVSLFGLFSGGQIMGVNGWDENFKFINFRYSFANSAFGCSEYLRYKFYLGITRENKLVNDGGCVGSDSLYQFKMKLNPLKVLKRYSWN